MTVQNGADTVDKAAAKAGEGQQETQERLFTQEEVNRIVRERLARAVPADYDDLKAKAAELDQIREAQATEQEKAIKAAVAQAVKDTTERLMRERVLDKIEVAAAGKFADVEDARLRLGARAEEFIKDGEIDTAAIADAVKAVLDAAPHLKAPESREPEVPSPADVGLGLRGTSGIQNVAPGVGRLAAAYAAGRSRK